MLLETPKSPATMLYDILEANEGTFYSAIELTIEINQKHNYKYTRDTIKNYIEVLKTLGNIIAEKSERKGIKKVPTKVYTLIKKIEPTC